MGINELADKIFNDIQARRTSTTSILREVRKLGKLLGNGEFDWVEKELKGYKLIDGNLPNYRTVNAMESRTWNGHLDTSIQRIYSSWLHETAWVNWILYQSVTVLEDLLTSGFTVNTGKVYKSIGTQKKDIVQLITVSGKEIKKALDLLQDKVSEQLSDILSKPQITKPSNVILGIIADKFPETSGDIDRIVQYLDGGQDFLLATRSCRPVLHAIIRALNINIPNGYIFTDGVPVGKTGEKSKIKYMLEVKGKKLFKDRERLLFIDNEFRMIYDIASKADKDVVNKYEANLCVDLLLTFLEKLYRYTDMQPLN